ncbi:MAG: hypothetical protein KAJ49_09870 [Arcobacteraceae bacterium]|nr:hypothetical protein [Arcobacteraceae bacterium]
MLKGFYLFIFFINLSASEFINIEINKNHGLLTFIESLSDVRYVSKAPKQLYIKNLNVDLKELKKLKFLNHKITRGAIYKYPYTRSFLEALYLESINHKTLDTFQKKITSYRTSLKEQDIKRYFDYLKKYTPIYEKLIWDKSYKTLQKRKIKLNHLIQKHNYDKLIRKIAKFYKIPQDEIGLFNIALYPIPFGNNINAYRIKNIETVGVLVNKNQNLKWLLTATILHEISHTLYFKSNYIKENFIKYETKKDKTTYQEIFATAIGAGWGYNKITNKISSTPWYNNKQYNRVSRKIYPKIKKYLDNNKTIDNDFVYFIKGQI